MTWGKLCIEKEQPSLSPDLGLREASSRWRRGGQHSLLRDVLHLDRFWSCPFASFRFPAPFPYEQGERWKEQDRDFLSMYLGREGYMGDRAACPEQIRDGDRLGLGRGSSGGRAYLREPGLYATRAQFSVNVSDSAHKRPGPHAPSRRLPSRHNQSSGTLRLSFSPYLLSHRSFQVVYSHAPFWERCAKARMHGCMQRSKQSERACPMLQPNQRRAGADPQSGPAAALFPSCKIWALVRQRCPLPVGRLCHWSAKVLLVVLKMIFWC